MALPRPTPPRPTGRVSLAQLQQDYQTEREEWDGMTTAQRILAANEASLQAMVDERSQLIDELTKDLVPAQTAAISALAAEIFSSGGGSGDPNKILQLWRDAATTTRQVIQQGAGIVAQQIDVDDQQENTDLARQDERSATDAANAASARVIADLNGLNLTSPPP